LLWYFVEAGYLSKLHTEYDMIIIAVACLGRTEDLERSLEEALIELRDLTSERFG